MLFVAGPGVLVIRAVSAKRAQAPARGRRVRSRSKPAASSRQNFDLSRVGACPGAGNLGVNPRVLSAACPVARWISRMRQAPRRLSSPGRRVFPMPLVSPGTVAETFYCLSWIPLVKMNPRGDHRVPRLDVSSVSGSGRRLRKSNRWFQRASLSLLVKSQEG